MKPTMTRALAYAASQDAGNRTMRAAGRTAWDIEDYNACVNEFDRLWPEELDGPWPEDTSVSPQTAPR
jgi:hypothetical protein